MDIGKVIQSRFKSPQQKAIVNLRYTSNWIFKKWNTYMSKHDISIAQFNILRILRGANDTLSVNTVKERMIEKSPNTTRLMDKLIEKGLIIRYRDENDKRIINVKITDLGLDLLAIIDIEFDQELTMLDVLTDAEANTLSDLLDKLRG
jgi:MarR family transcriptional regulator, 2-MHQ and catechol-resistance regulon repressor